MSSLELVDVVDQNDTILYSLPKKEVCEEKELFHRIAAVFVFLPNDDLVVQHRKKDNLFDHSAAGHVHSGETYLEAAKRELLEELGIQKDLKEISRILPLKDFGISYRHHFFLAETKIQSVKELIPSDNEVKGLIPMSIAAIIEEMNQQPGKYTFGFKVTLSSYIQYKGLKYPAITLK